jgi:hypothetical protein
MTPKCPKMRQRASSIQKFSQGLEPRPPLKGGKSKREEEGKGKGGEEEGYEIMWGERRRRSRTGKEGKLGEEGEVRKEGSREKERAFQTITPLSNAWLRQFNVTSPTDYTTLISDTGICWNFHYGIDSFGKLNQIGRHAKSAAVESMLEVILLVDCPIPASCRWSLVFSSVSVMVKKLLTVFVHDRNVLRRCVLPMRKVNADFQGSADWKLHWLVFQQ